MASSFLFRFPPQCNSRRTESISLRRGLSLKPIGSRCPARLIRVSSHTRLYEGGGARLLLPGLAQHCMGLDANAFHSIHHNQRAVAEARSSADLAAEVHMPGGVDEIDQMPCAAWPGLQCRLDSAKAFTAAL